MDLKFREYQVLRIKKQIKKEFLLLSNGSSQNCNIWITKIKPDLNKFGLKAYKVLNKLTLKIIRKSRYKNLITIVTGNFWLIYLNFKKNVILDKNILKNNLDLKFFKVLAVKLNNRIYSIKQLKSMNSLSFTLNVSLLYQFLLLQLKKIYTMV